MRIESANVNVMVAAIDKSVVLQEAVLRQGVNTVGLDCGKEIPMSRISTTIRMEKICPGMHLDGGAKPQILGRLGREEDAATINIIVPRIADLLKGLAGTTKFRLTRTEKITMGGTNVVIARAKRT